MKKIISLLCVSFNIVIAIGQKSFFTASVTGTIVDAESKQPIEYVSVAILSRPDSSLVNGVITAADGRFTFDNVPVGHYLLKYSFVGYKTGYKDSVVVTPKNKIYDAGIIGLTQSKHVIEEVVVKGEKSLYENKIDRKVFNADQVITGKSGNAADLLKQVPSVDVDMDGKVSLRGSENVTILVNGKPAPTSDVTAYLQQMQANSIDKIEVITNPSAKYDPDGTSGILNIVLKKGLEQGFNGSVNINSGFGSKADNTFDIGKKYNGGINLNYNPGKYNVFASYNYRREPRWAKGNQDRTTNYNNITYYNNEHSLDLSERYSHNIKSGIDYYVTAATTIGISGGANIKKSNSVDSTLYAVNMQNLGDTSYYRTANEASSGSGFDGQAYVLHNFNNTGHNIRLDVNIATDNNSDNNVYVQDTVVPLLANKGKDKVKTISDFDIFSIQTDYALPLSNGSKFESGLKYQTKLNGTNLIADTLTKGIWMPRPLISNNFAYDEKIFAAYSTFNQSFGNFSYQAGLRVEYSNIASTLKTTNSNYNNAQIQLFPTLHLLQKLNDNNEINVSYSRRVNRPGGQMLNPFPDYSNPKSLRVGNPKLNPEFIHSVEIGFTWKKDRNTIQPTLFYRYTQNGFTRYQTQLSPTIMQVEWQNLKNTKSIGADFNVTYQLVKFWTVNLSLSGYEYSIETASSTNAITKTDIGYNGKIMSNTMLPWSTGVQFTYFYRSPFISPQGKSDPMYGANLGIKKDILKGKATCTLAANDIFNTQHMHFESEGANFKGSFTRKRESRVFYAGILYRFGVTPKNFKKKENGRERDSGEGSGDEMGF